MVPVLGCAGVEVEDDGAGEGKDLSRDEDGGEDEDAAADVGALGDHVAAISCSSSSTCSRHCQFHRVMRADI